MTTVEFFRRDGYIYGFRAEGHAGYAEYGSDVVCAAISALTQATVNGLTDVVGAQVTTVIDESKGICSAKLPKGQTEDIIAKSQILFRTLELALTAISKDGEYSGTLRIKQ